MLHPVAARRRTLRIDPASAPAMRAAASVRHARRPPRERFVPRAGPASQRANSRLPVRTQGPAVNWRRREGLPQNAENCIPLRARIRDRWVEIAVSSLARIAADLVSKSWPIAMPP